MVNKDVYRLLLDVTVIILNSVATPKHCTITRCRQQRRTLYCTAPLSPYKGRPINVLDDKDDDDDDDKGEG